MAVSTALARTASGRPLKQTQAGEAAGNILVMGSAVSSDMTVNDVQLDNIQYITDVMTLVKKRGLRRCHKSLAFGLGFLW